MSMKKLVVGLPVLVLLATGACDDEDTGTPVDGGATDATAPPVGGADAAPGVDVAPVADAAPGADTAAAVDTASGTDTAPGGGTCNIPCFMSLPQDCAPEGTCMTQIMGTTSNICYANGVKITSAISTNLPPTMITGTTTFSKAGAVCYVVESVTDVATQMTSIMYKNAAGAVVATGAITAGSVSVSCNGMSYDLATSGCGQSGMPTSMPTGCTMGACP